MPDISSLSVAALYAENNNLKQELQVSHARFHQLVSQLSQASACNDGEWDWNVQTDTVYLSPRWKEMLGYEDDELPNAFSTWTNLIHPDDFDDALRVVNEFLASTNLFYQSVHRLRHKNGNWIWIFDRGVAVRDEKNQVIRFSGSHTDITLLRNLEEDLLQREREFNSIIQINPDGIVTFSNENKISTVNSEFLKITGFSLSELQNLDKNEFDTKMLAISHHDHPYQKEIKNGESVLIWLINDDVKEINTKKNSRFNFNFKRRHENHRILKMTQHELNTINTPVILYFRDVTLEMEMDQLKTNFLSVAAHELRMPIASIYGYSELLIHRDFDDLTRRDILQAIHGLCASIVELINHLLDLARIEAQCTNVCDFYPLTQVVKEILDEFKVYGDFRQIGVYYFVDEASLIYADKDQLKRAIINLLSNAVKYSLNGQHVELELRSRIHNETEQIGIIVKDKGIGISAENIPHIFERFWRADNVSDIIGTGLGMALVKEIADLHHAEIDVQSELGKGTIVSLWLPAKPIVNELGIFDE